MSPVLNVSRRGPGRLPSVDRRPLGFTRRCRLARSLLSVDRCSHAQLHHVPTEGGRACLPPLAPLPISTALAGWPYAVSRPTRRKRLLGSVCQRNFPSCAPPPSLLAEVLVSNILTPWLAWPVHRVAPGRPLPARLTCRRAQGGKGAGPGEIELKALCCMVHSPARPACRRLYCTKFSFRCQVWMKI